MIARHERTIHPAHQLVRKQSRIAKSRPAGEENREFRAGETRDQTGAPIRLDSPFDPARDRLKHLIAGGSAEGGIDMVVAADREQECDHRICRTFAKALGDPGSGGPRIAKAGERISPALQSSFLAADHLHPAKDLAITLDPDMMGDPATAESAVAMGESGCLPGRDDPRKRVPGGLAALGIEPSEERPQAHPSPFLRREAGLPGQSGAQFHEPGVWAPSPGRAVADFLDRAPG